PLSPAGPAVAPEPPAGPGVTPPFPAPPTEGGAKRLWLGLGVAGLAFVVCCGGGAAAFVALLATTARAYTERAEAVVSEYLDDVRERRYGEAYGALCQDLRRDESARAFARRLAAEPQISDYELADIELVSEIVMPATVTYDDGSSDTLRFVLEPDSEGALEVCRIDG
ncbi:MAG TPA: hypothetical protein VES42_28660, partial [Pilimelia sp.]|nr:hypothetical protein [Pilimelia sp.]